MIYSILWLYRSNSGRSATLLYAYSSPERSNTLELKHLVYFVIYLTCPVCPSLVFMFLSSASPVRSQLRPVSGFCVPVQFCQFSMSQSLSQCSCFTLTVPYLIRFSSSVSPDVFTLSQSPLVYLNPISFLFFVVSSLAVCLLEDLKVWLDYLFLAFILFVL